MTLDAKTARIRAETTSLLAVHGDEPPGLDRLLPHIYDQLKGMAHVQLSRERGRDVLQTTALVHEAYVRLVDDTRVTRKGRAYFFGAAARAMRQILVDHARRANALKRGGGQVLESLHEGSGAVDAFAAELLDLHGALERLGEHSPRQARVVECRYFGGLSVQETADALDLSPRTVKYDWAMARAWLYRELGGENGSSGAAP